MTNETLEYQVTQLTKQVEQLEQELALLKNELSTIRFEGCWKYHEDPHHRHTPKE